MFLHLNNQARSKFSHIYLKVFQFIFRRVPLPSNQYWYKLCINKIPKKCLRTFTIDDEIKMTNISNKMGKHEDHLRCRICVISSILSPLPPYSLLCWSPANNMLCKLSHHPWCMHAYCIRIEGKTTQYIYKKEELLAKNESFWNNRPDLRIFSLMNMEFWLAYKFALIIA
jgi:hypothetical protein